MKPEKYHANYTPCDDIHKSHICQFVHNPFFECHCMSVSSENIPKILAVCGDKFRSCSIYRREIKNSVLAINDEIT